MPLGAVRPLLGPSWLTADPRMTARIRSPSAFAADNRLSTTMPLPSPRPYPSALAENVLHRPSGAIARRRDRPKKMVYESISATPPAKATSHSPARRLWQARWMDTSADEQAVSTARLGPCRPSRYD